MTCSPTLRKHSRSGGFAIIAAMCVATAQPGFCASGRGSPADAERFIERNLDLTDTPLTLEQLRKRIGAATESSRAVANLHVPGQTDHIVTLKAKDLEVEGLCAGHRHGPRAAHHADRRQSQAGRTICRSVAHRWTTYTTRSGSRQKARKGRAANWPGVTKRWRETPA